MLRWKMIHLFAFLLLLFLSLAGLVVHQERIVQSALYRTLRRAGLAKLAAFGNICHGVRCQAVLDSLTAGKADRVPRIRHILWKSDVVSTYFAKQLKSWAIIHPDWTYVLWRDSDLQLLVSKHYSGAVEKFSSLSEQIMRVDMSRYLILHRFGGVYADLDYTLLRPLDRFLKYPAVVPLETEAFALLYHGMRVWPAPFLNNPAFMLSEPGHAFFHFCILRLMANPAREVFTFAGPLGLSFMLKRFATDHRAASLSVSQVVFVPPSRAFASYTNNSFVSSASEYKNGIIATLKHICSRDVRKAASAPAPLRAYCQDVYNLDPITNRSELAYAVHDSNKLRSSYDHRGSPQFYEDAVNIRTVLPNIIMADKLI